MLLGDDQELPADPLQAVQQPDELGIAEIPPFQLPQQPLTAARCVNVSLVQPDNAEEEPPSTACRQSTVMAPGGVPLGRGPQGHQHSPGGLRGRHIPPPPPPPPSSTSSTRCSSTKCSYLSKGVGSTAHKAKGSRRRRPT